MISSGPCHPKRQPCPRAAFTMIEIAIALAVIGFALVAIIGILPTGMNVQRENREETIINQDGPFLLEAIRSSARGLDDLTNYVLSVVVLSTNSGPLRSNYYAFNSGSFGGFTNGAGILSLFTTPKYQAIGAVGMVTNTVLARVKAISGGAIEKTVNDLAFTYRMTPEVIPYSANLVSDNDLYPHASNAVLPANISEEDLARWQRYDAVLQMSKNMYEFRLLFQWPLLPSGNVGSGRQLFRTVVSAYHIGSSNANFNQLTNNFFTPQAFTRVEP